jgi:hypothetical protein
MRATVQKNFIISLRAVHTRLRTLVMQARTKGILEGHMAACADDLARAAEDVQGVIQQLESTNVRKTPNR